MTGGGALLPPPFPGGFEFAVPFGEDLLLPSFELVAGRDMAEGPVRADRLEVLDKPGDDASGVLQG